MKKTTCKTSKLVDRINSIDKAKIKEIFKIANYYGANTVKLPLFNGGLIERLEFNIIYKGINFYIIKPALKGNYKDIHFYFPTYTFEMRNFKKN